MLKKVAANVSGLCEGKELEYKCLKLLQMLNKEQMLNTPQMPCFAKPCYGQYGRVKQSLSRNEPIQWQGWLIIPLTL